MLLTEISDEEAIKKANQKFRKQKELRKQNPRPFDSSKTDMPFYDRMIADPENARKNQGFKFTITKMSPREYIRKSADGFRSSISNIEKRTNSKTVTKYANKMRNGETFPMLVLQYTLDGHFTQEGLHRAFAAKEVGYDYIPVMVVEEIK